MKDDPKILLQKLIEQEVFVVSDKETILTSVGTESGWLFDFRRILLRADVLDGIGDIFLTYFKNKLPLQVGCLEVAGIPLATGITFSLYKRGENINSFFIRKSRKKQGLLKMVEGSVGEEKIVLVDDIINSGNSFMRQIEVLESMGKKVDTVFVILRFRDESYYEHLHSKGIKIVSVFCLDDFSESLKVKNLLPKEHKQTPMPYEIDWYFKSENPNFFYVVPKSAPAIDDKRLYFGSDSGNFWALNKNDGSVVWKYKVGFHALGKYIFSSPLVFKDKVYFGAYDGNFYALNSETGKKEWVFMEADWIGSSPCVSKKHNHIYIGLEFGLFNKQGGVAALDLDTGKKIWDITTEKHIHASPGYSDKYDIVVCGSNNNSVYGLGAKKGDVIWEFKTEGEVKESVVFSDKEGLVLFGSHDSYLYALDITTGKLRYRFKTGEAIYSTPLVYDGKVYVASLDKKVYCINLKSGLLEWEFATSARIFASPEVVEGKIIIGSNDARMYELDPLTGENTAVFQAVERITNKVVYDDKSKRLFLPTFANEIFCLKKNEDV
ncbi:PQQ-binding-like beta-propeller repeat protein [Candidatus Kaiserbacteria bacterium]|nr:PQQ-binding-like beta-propeller repeat protein [Candidatus Kaiserbacteria bacterium]